MSVDLLEGLERDLDYETRGGPRQLKGSVVVRALIEVTTEHEWNTLLSTYPPVAEPTLVDLLPQLLTSLERMLS